MRGAGLGPHRDTEPSERVEAGLEQAELIALGVGKNVPGLLTGLADVGRARPELQESFELAVLFAVGGVDVDVQSELPGPRVAAGAEDEGGLRAAEAGVGWPDLDASVVFPAEFDVAEDLAPERGEPAGTGARRSAPRTSAPISPTTPPSPSPGHARHGSSSNARGTPGS